MSPFEHNGFKLGKAPEVEEFLPQADFRNAVVTVGFVISLGLINAGLPGSKFISPFTYAPSVTLRYTQAGFGQTLFEEIVYADIDQSVFQFLSSS